jgi:hypothetical protein
MEERYEKVAAYLSFVFFPFIQFIPFLFNSPSRLNCVKNTQDEILVAPAELTSPLGVGFLPDLLDAEIVFFSSLLSLFLSFFVKRV